MGDEKKETATCHLCLHHRWPSLQTVVWKNEAGKGFCVFHAPEEGKRHALGSEERLDSVSFTNHVLKHIEGEQKQVTLLREEQKECVLSGTIFPWDISFQHYGAKNPLPAIDLRRAKFCGKATFTYVNFSGAADFALATFSKEADFRGIKANDGALDMGGLEPESLGNLVFRRIEVPLFTFRSSTWPQLLALETFQEGRLVTCEELYRAMKQRAAGEHDQPMVSRWHYREKLMGLKQTVGGVEKDKEKVDTEALGLLEGVDDDGFCVMCRTLHWLLLAITPPMRWWGTLTWWYWSSSGFGERPKRAFVLLLTLMLPVFSIMLCADLRPEDADGSIWGRILAALQHLMFVTNPTAAPKGPFWASLVVVLTRVAIPVQFGLFALAVRNHFRR